MLSALAVEMALDDGLEFKKLEQTRGFLVHIARTYPAVVPYLKGLHLTLDSWRPNRDGEGWKRSVKELREAAAQGFWDETGECWVPINPMLGGEHGRPPAKVRPVGRLAEDLRCLGLLLYADEPPVRMIRSTQVCVALYGFGDASGAGFGSSIQVGSEVLFRYGLWGKDMEDQSSNFRELLNLVETVEEGVEAGDLRHAEVFIFTDNTVAEAAFYKGNSSNKHLFELVLRLRVLDNRGDLRLQLVHVAGTRMIAQGTDGLSRGDLTEGIMTGQGMLSFVPLNEDAITRSPSLLSWVRSWTEEDALHPLTPAGWFSQGHGVKGGQKDTEGIWAPIESQEAWLLWAPPPAAAETVMEELNLSRHKRSDRNHVFVCPRLMTHTWRKRLYKLADVVFEVPAGARPVWPVSMHEPLVIGLILRFVSCPPWQLRRCNRVLELEGELQSVWKDPTADEGFILRKLCQLPRDMEAL